VKDEVEDQQILRTPYGDAEFIGRARLWNAIDQMVQVTQNCGDALIEVKSQRHSRSVAGCSYSVRSRCADSRRAAYRWNPHHMPPIP
jgi:hypothetical protein